jgi:hypothetical protein
MVDIARSAVRPSRAIGFLAALGVFPHVKGSGAPAAAAGTAEPRPARLKRVLCFAPVLVLASLALTAAPALAAPETPVTEQALSVYATTALLHGELNPAGGEEGQVFQYEFLYNAGASCTGGKTAPLPAEAYLAERAGRPVFTKLTGLAPSTQYTFCLLERNAAEETSTGPPVTFTTAALTTPVIEELYATKVTSSSAKLEAKINPGGVEAGYHFEYAAPGGAYQSIPGGQGTIEEGIAGKLVSVEIQEGLLANTQYHYRIVATNTAGTVETAPSDTPSFTTQATGTGFDLVDNRAWEMVTPQDKHGARIEAIAREGGVTESSEDGSKIAYVASAPVTSDPAGNASIDYSPVIANRGGGGWVTEEIAAPHETAAGFHTAVTSEYLSFSGDLGEGLVEQPEDQPGNLGSTLLDPSLASEETVYIRTNLGQGGEAKYLPLVDDADVESGTHYGHQIHFRASTPDLKHVVFGSQVPLKTEHSVNKKGLYEWSEGTLHPVSILPDEEWLGPVAANLGDQDGYDQRGTISANGEKVFWSAEGHLYMRNTLMETTVQLDVAQEGLPEPEGEPDANFQYANPEGSRVYFTDNQRLTKESMGAGVYKEEPAEDLYEYNTITGKLRDLTPDSETEGAAVQGNIIGATENGEYVYFVANGLLGNATGAGVTGGTCLANHFNKAANLCNLYVAHVSGNSVTTTLIAVLSGEDEADWRAPGGGLESGSLVDMTSRMSPNGEYLAFMSDRSLTGYDNTDAVSGASDEEVFLYDKGSGKLVCASCNPTGARPHGVLDKVESGEGLGLLVDRHGTWEGETSTTGRWLAGSVPGWTGWKENNAQYQSRYLSNEGRLFFDAADALVPDDVNGKEDVYEYEPEGLGPAGATCGPGSDSGSEVFKPEHAFVDGEGRGGEEATGCVGLISSGTSAKESAFLDASAKGPNGEEGEDVFFLTAEQLSPADVDSADDIYDAHTCSTASPCNLSSTVTSPPCTTADSCRSAPAPQPAIFGSPASATFSGAGNVAPAVAPAVTTKKKTAAELKAEKLAKALKTCRTKMNKQKRQGCEKQARSKYGGQSKSKTKVKAKSKSHKGGK